MVMPVVASICGWRLWWRGWWIPGKDLGALPRCLIRFSHVFCVYVFVLCVCRTTPADCSSSKELEESSPIIAGVGAILVLGAHSASTIPSWHPRVILLGAVVACIVVAWFGFRVRVLQECKGEEEE
jgi:hypothetical protein